ncbi:MAG: imidazole glycerol phosphate synthase subunit HisH [candidate division Zixibacteria bacterium]|nr:imidazole glycerol phosphate synthase subunit HisH [candidate division Zixibacteria bacterium]
MITIIDYGMGNLRSIQNMLKHIGAESEISSDPAVILKAEKLILPGVGAFDQAVSNIDSLGIRSVIVKKANEDKVPVLGICLGMQLLGRCSEEGNSEGLGLIDVVSKKFEFSGNENKLNVPHMGWNTLTPTNDRSLFHGMSYQPRFYFVHSYHVVCNNSGNILARTDYGIEFISAIIRDNVFGVQFHPEKSHKFGMKLLQNFAEIGVYA